MRQSKPPSFGFQVHEILRFLDTLRDQCSQRERGTDVRGSTKGSHNHVLVEAMGDIRSVADLQALRRSPSSGILRDVDAALRRLERRRIIPATCVTNACLKAAYTAIHRTRDGLSNQQLYKELWTAAQSDSLLKTYMEVVTRLWLISPAESVVESMASVVKEVFGVHRRLSHEAAATELLVRWNGPDIANTEPLINMVQKKNRFNFCRSGFGIGVAVEGTVIARYKSKRCPTLSMYRQ